MEAYEAELLVVQLPHASYNAFLTSQNAIVREACACV